MCIFCWLSWVPVLLLANNSRSFPESWKIMTLSDCRSPAVFKYADKPQLLSPYIQCDSTIHHNVVKSLVVSTSTGGCLEWFFFRNDLLCVEWDVKLYVKTLHSIMWGSFCCRTRSQIAAGVTRESAQHTVMNHLFYFRFIIVWLDDCWWVDIDR